MIRTLLILSASITILISCQTKPNELKRSQLAIENEEYTRKIYPKYDKKNYDGWQKLKQLLAKDLISAKKLGIIDCQGIDRNSDELTLKLTLHYKILNSLFMWNTYETSQGTCIESVNNNVGLFFLSIPEARVLLSAANSYHFKKLGLEPSTILYKRTVSENYKNRNCGLGGSTIEYKEDKQIIRSGCEVIIFYGKESESKKNDLILFPKKKQ